MVADGDGRKREARSVRHFHVYVFGPRSVEEITGDEQIREGSYGARDNDEPQEPANGNGTGKFTLNQRKIKLSIYLKAETFQYKLTHQSDCKSFSENSFFLVKFRQN